MTISSENFFKLSSAQFPERDRIEASREVIGRSLMKMRFELRSDVPFNIDMVFRALPDFVLATGVCSAMDCLRTPDLIESDDIILTVALSGDSVLHVRGKEIPIGPTNAALTRTSDVCRCEIQSASNVINFRFPLGKIAPLIADFDAALLRPIPINSEALRLLVHYADMLKEESWVTDPNLQRLMASHLQDLAVLAIGAKRDATMEAGVRGLPAARLRAIKADIVQNLTDRHLSIGTVALRHGISPRYVSMLFDGEGTTFSEFVLLQRLNRAYRMLTDPRFLGRAIHAVASESGFGDLSYFNRCFRRVYGMTPSDVRASPKGLRPN
jgi:AraC-like DNA-binding protein